MNTEVTRDMCAAPVLDHTGERMMPEASDRFTFWEHVYRYAFACRFVVGKRVLDIACGEGYGTAALERAGAAAVLGVDVSDQACLHARQKYGLDTAVGNAEGIPLADGSMDVVVSFETIEHVRDPERFVDECVRVLAPAGILIVSTPNREVYSAVSRPKNPFHCSEMTEAEFLTLLSARFPRVRLYTQRPASAAWWSPRVLASDAIAQVRGVARVLKWTQIAWFPRAVREPTDAERSAVVALTLSERHRLNSPLNLYALRPWSSVGRERPAYLIAVAVSKDG